MSAFEDNLNQRFVILQTEFNRNLYRYFTLRRDLAKIEEDLNRIEASLAEMEHTQKDWTISKVNETMDNKKEK